MFSIENYTFKLVMYLYMGALLVLCSDMDVGENKVEYIVNVTYIIKNHKCSNNMYIS